MKLDGAVVIVTGAAAGLGQATAARLQDEGASVVGFDRDAGAMDGGCAVDVADAAGVDAAVASVVDLHGRLDSVVHCAGVAAGFRLLGRDGPADPERFRRVIEVNLIGTFNVLRSAAWAMRTNEPVDGERGVIVTTASIAAFEGQLGQVAYAASKAGVAGMTLPVARELGALGIRCVSIAPGAFETALTTELEPELQRRLTEAAAFPHRLGRPDEYAELAVAVLRNEMLNGEVIRLDGGSRLGPR